MMIKQKQQAKCKWRVIEALRDMCMPCILYQINMIKYGGLFSDAKK